MVEGEGLENLEIASDGARESLQATTATLGAFNGEMRRIGESAAATGKDVAVLERGLSRGLRKAFDGLVFDGDSLSTALDGLGRSMMNTVYSAAMRPITNQVGSMIAGGVSTLVEGILPFADGASFSQGRVMPFAAGGVVSGPTMFPMRGGTGLMGEAGPEAIMPLARGPDGKLGVRGSGGGNTVVINVSTPDAQSFQRSQGQIAAQVNRALGRGNRNR